MSQQNSRIEEIKTRLEKATKGEWTIDAGLSLCAPLNDERFPDIKEQMISEFELSDQGRRDAEFIAHSKSDIEYLLKRTADLETHNQYLLDAHDVFEKEFKDEIGKYKAALEKCKEQRDKAVYYVDNDGFAETFEKNFDKELEEILK